MFKHKGFCVICDEETMFESKHDWFRDHLLCTRCHSIPRERALMKAIKDFFPDFRNLEIHESSPTGRGVSMLLKRECRGYSYSHYFPHVEPGEKEARTDARCENLEKLTFEDNSFDLFITQDVLEHIFDPEAAFKEIARVLKDGGAHIFTAPLTNKAQPSQRRAELLTSGEIKHHFEPEFHGNPVDSNGSLVTMNWGYDIAAFITRSSGMFSVIMQTDDIDQGIRAEYIDVIVSHKRFANVGHLAKSAAET